MVSYLYRSYISKAKTPEEAEERRKEKVEVLEKAITLNPAGATDKEAALDIARRNLAAAYEMNGQPGKANEIRDRFNL